MDDSQYKRRSTDPSYSGFVGNIHRGTPGGQNVTINGEICVRGKARIKCQPAPENGNCYINGMIGNDFYMRNPVNNERHLNIHSPVSVAEVEIEVIPQQVTVNPNPPRRSGIYHGVNSNTVSMDLCEDETKAENWQRSVFPREGRSTEKEGRTGRKGYTVKQNQTKECMQKTGKTQGNEKNSTGDGDSTNSSQWSSAKKNVLKIEAGTIEQNEEHRATDPMQDHDNVRDPNGQRRSKRSRDGDGDGDGEVIHPPPKNPRISFLGKMAEQLPNAFHILKDLIFGTTTHTVDPGCTPKECKK